MADKTFRVVRLTDKAIAPIRSSAKAAGYDLASAYDYLVPAGGKELFFALLIRVFSRLLQHVPRCLAFRKMPLQNRFTNRRS